MLWKLLRLGLVCLCGSYFDKELFVSVDATSTRSCLSMEAAVAASMAEYEAIEEELKDLEDELQGVLSHHELGATLDTTTPADGHCLFHALLRGGLVGQVGSLSQPTVWDLRRAAVEMASLDELEIAGASTDEGLSVDEYREGMLSGDLWGDNLMIYLLARRFSAAISVLSGGAARTWFADGSEQLGMHHGALWIVHRREKHYYGVARAVPVVGHSSRHSLECPLCTVAFTCAVCTGKGQADADQARGLKRRLTGKTADPMAEPGPSAAASSSGPGSQAEPGPSAAASSS
eukprot:12309592-Heterocapsa_arctica.AAC.1